MVAPVPLTPGSATSLLQQWCPGLQRSGTRVDDTPALRLVCLASSGNSEDMYTAECTGARRAPSPLLAWCRAHQVEILAVQYPGRGSRNKEPCLRSARDMAMAILNALGSRLEGSPWGVLGHSVGCLVGYELVQLAKHRPSLSPPQVFIAAAFTAPGICVSRRPWTPNARLDDEAFAAEVRAWGASEALFEPTIWNLYLPLLRHDYTMFDTAPEFSITTERTLMCPVVAQWATRDSRISESHVREWAEVTAEGVPFVAEAITGTHMFPLDKENKAAWLEKVVGHLERILGASTIL